MILDIGIFYSEEVFVDLAIESDDVRYDGSLGGGCVGAERQVGIRPQNIGGGSITDSNPQRWFRVISFVTCGRYETWDSQASGSMFVIIPI